jgi:hypothetical protein
MEGKKDDHLFANRIHVFYTCDCGRDFACPSDPVFECIIAHVNLIFIEVNHVTDQPLARN